MACLIGASGSDHKVPNESGVPNAMYLMVSCDGLISRVSLHNLRERTGPNSPK